TCSVCAHSFQDTPVNATGHAWDAWASNGDGTHTRICGNDPAHAQTEACAYGSAVTPPTCSEAGFTTHTCSVCAHSYQDTPVNATGHAWGAWASNGDGTHTTTCGNDPAHTVTENCLYELVVTPPACTAPGISTYTCLTCAYRLQQDPTDPLGHAWGSWGSNGDGTHTRACANDPAHTQTEACAYGSVVTPPTCTEAGFTTHTCPVCAHAYQDTPTAATGHAWANWLMNGDGTHTRICANDASHTETVPCTYSHIVVPPGCTSGGYTINMCIVCSHVYFDAHVGALGHDWGAWAANGDGTHTRACARNHAHTESEPCAYGQAVTPPTCTESGFTTHTCAGCGHSFDDTPVPASGHAWGPWLLNGSDTHTRTCGSDPAHQETRDFGIPWIDRVWAEPLGGTSIKVSWNGGPGAQGYEVWYGESLNGPWKLARATGDTAYAKTYLEPGVRYWFKARAYVTEEGARVCAAFSPPVCGVPLAKAKITEAFASGATRIRLAWEPVPGATGYVVSVAATSVGPYEPRVTTTATACTLTGLSPGTAYFLKVTPHARIFGTTYSGIPSGYRSVKTLPM
ncbi:MAG TPA: fibronectin type III domain-containing protein, partial [Candidatus Limnocylindria bacterium]|nr:fibronectin type III domain-containing protein [Candidatus Limnocylindria bacterium]